MSEQPTQRIGRPVKQPHEKRLAQMNIRFTLAEAEFIRANAAIAGISEAEFVRRAVMGTPLKPAPSKIDAALISELNSCGVLVNQLARAVHRGRPLPDYWREIADDLSALLTRIARDYGA